MEAKRWNERLKLLMTSLNATSIGTFGLGAVAPFVAAVAAERAQAIGPATMQLPELSFVKNVMWPAVVVALFLHICAHLVVSFMEPEKD